MTWVQYLAYCLAAGLLQSGYAKIVQGRSGGARSISYLPLGLSGAGVEAIIGIVAFLSFVGELILGIMFISWWAGLLLWVPAFSVAYLFFPSRNPAVPLLISLVLTMSLILLLLLS